MLDKELIIRLLTILKPYQPMRVSVFGSIARGESEDTSDLDVLVKFKMKIGLIRLVQIQQEISDELGIQVDLVTENNLKNPILRNSILQDLVTIYNEVERSALY